MNEVLHQTQDDILGLNDPPSRVGTGSLNASDLMEDVNNAPDALFNQSQPLTYRQREQPHHRIFILLKAQGLSNVEIHKRTGYTVACIADILKQPWARERLMSELNKNGRDEVINIFKSNASDLAWELVDLAKNDEKGSVRLGAINSIHDRLMGKPNQPISHSVEMDTKSMSDDEMLAYLNGFKPSKN